MLIKKLELSGFKSFMNPAALDFGGGITAILGPNGCGKSNVVDALRWVLGEQSAKQLRGERMANVVFGGTRHRKPLGMAEVSVTFSNLDGRMATPYQEVRLTRRLSREGESDYLVNGAPVRLKDLRDLLTDTGAGSHGYSIIEREMVDTVIGGHEDLRRFLLEEASGIMKYRLRRREAERKLEMTAQDLLRLDDLVEEVAREVRSLRRQLGRTRRYQELQEQLRRTETYLAQRRLLRYREETARLRAELEDVQHFGVGEDAASEAIGARIAALRLEMADIERVWREHSMRCESLAEKLRGREQALVVLRERSDTTRDAQAAARGEIEATADRLLQVQRDHAGLEARRTELAAQLEERRETFREAKEKLEAQEATFDRARADLLAVKQRTFDFAETSATRRSEIEVLRAKLESNGVRALQLADSARDASDRAARLAEELATVTKEVEGAEGRRTERQRQADAGMDRDEELVGLLEARREERAQLRAELDTARSRLDLLRTLEDSREGYGRGPKNVLERHAGTPRLLGSLAELVQAPRALEAAFDALLADVLDAILVRDLDSALDLVGELRDQDLGRATFVVPGAETASTDGGLRDLLGEPGVVGLAVDLVTLEGRAGQALRRLLGQAIVVEDAATARRLLLRHGEPQLRIATRDGLLFTGAGLVRGGGGGESGAGLLGRKQRLQELGERVTAVEQSLAETTASCAATETTLRLCRNERREMEQILRLDEEELLRLSVTRASLSTAFEECNGRCGEAQHALGAVEAESERLAQALPELTQDAERLTRENEEQKRAVAALEAEFNSIESERERLRHDTNELRVAFVEVRGEVESCERQSERLAELERELADLRTRRQEDVERAARDLETWARESTEAQAEAAKLAQEMEAARQQRDEVGVRLDAQRTQLEAEQAELHAHDKERREQQNRQHALELQLSQGSMQAQNLLERIQEQYGLAEAELLALQFEWSDADPVPDEDVVRELRDSIGKLGPVNLLALEEFDSKSQRLTFLEAQRADLAQASASLQQTIEKINTTACFLFLETYEQVRQHFRETIRTVFEGGEGDLVLTQPSEPLESDVELRVRPRGKKIDTLTQLSSGERALTAIALLFSIYLVKPSPFCVFDEVGAPLDDANIARFLALLDRFKDHTQFIVITHNKLTMEAADYLYGVTMEEEGVSKLVSVALDGKLAGQPRSLRRKTERATVRAATLLRPAEVGVLPVEEGAPAAAAELEVPAGDNGSSAATQEANARPAAATLVGNGNRRPAARLEKGVAAALLAAAERSETEEPAAEEARAEEPLV